MNENSKKINQIKTVLKKNWKALSQQMFCEDLDLSFEERKDYNERLYGPKRGSQKFMRLGRLPVFELYHQGYFGIGKYEDYRALAKESWGFHKKEDSLAVFIFFAAHDFEISTAERIQNFALTKGAKWWQRRVLWTVWQGKQKELIFGRELKKSLPEGYSLRKPTEAEDQKYMTDFMIEQNGVMALGISVKGESYRNGKIQHNDWVMAKESIEDKGHANFEQDFGKSVVVAISSIEDDQLVAEEVTEVIYWLKNGKPSYEPKYGASPADSPWVTMSGDFPELTF